MRNLSVLLVSTVNVSSAGNLIAVFVSPVWIILSAIDTSPANVPTPVTLSPDVFPNILNPLAVTIPT